MAAAGFAGREAARLVGTVKERFMVMRLGVSGVEGAVFVE